eukprot:3126875-Pyramimonas_sp.AAC.1
MSLEERAELDKLEKAQNAERTRQGRSHSYATVPSYSLPGPLPGCAIAVHPNYSPAEATASVHDMAQAITEWSRQVLWSIGGDEIGEGFDPAPSDIEWPCDTASCCGPLSDPVSRRLLNRHAFIANLFCRQRREGDIQQAVEISLETHTPSF